MQSQYLLAIAAVRSEEHTSELQSQSNLVCRLLLEKKKNIQKKKSDVENTTKLQKNNHGKERDIDRIADVVNNMHIVMHCLSQNTMQHTLPRIWRCHSLA